MNFVKSHRPSVVTVLALIAIAALITTWIVKANQHPDSGMVYGKKYHQPSSWVQMICSAYNSKGICVAYMPITHHVPECYELTLRAEGDEWGVCVDQHTYDTIPYESTFKVAS